jgi:CheY-like chemotaxis protein
VDCGYEEATPAPASEFYAVMIDVRMTEVDGLYEARRIRALAGPRGSVPIVALTAQVFAEQMDEFRAAGMDDHLAKPFTPDALLTVLARVVAPDHRCGSLEATQPRSEPTLVARNESVGPASEPVVAPVAPVLGSELPVLNREAFERTAAFLSSEAVISYLEILAERGEALRHALHDPNSVTHAGIHLAAAAHTLAGSAGMFGFERLAAVARRSDGRAGGASDRPRPCRRGRSFPPGNAQR